MRISRTGSLLAISLAGTLALAGCGSGSSNAGASSSTRSGNSTGSTSSGGTTSSGGAGGGGAAVQCASGHISGSGSSFQAPMQSQWSTDYTQKCSGAKVDYNSVGSGQGIQDFGNGTTDFAGSDVTMKDTEQSKADSRCGGNKAIHIPITAGGVAVTWNLDGVKDLKFSPDTLADIFSGKVTKWNDPEIKADNAGANLPSTAITVVYRSDGSGTNSVFTSYLAAASKKWTLGSGKAISWPTGQGANGNQGVSAAVSQTPGAITYTEQAFAMQHNLPMAQIKNGSGQFVSLSPDTVSQALASMNLTGTAPDLSAKINFEAQQGYPISTVSYVIVCSTYPSSFKGQQLLKSYLSYALADGQTKAKDLGFAPLPQSLVSKATQSVSSIS